MIYDKTYVPIWQVVSGSYSKDKISHDVPQALSVGSVTGFQSIGSIATELVRTATEGQTGSPRTDGRHV